MQSAYPVGNVTMTDPQKIKMDVKETLAYVMGDSSPDMLSEMSLIFLEDSLPLINQIINGYSKQNFDMMRTAAHALKGSSATIGLEQLAKLCQDIETNSKQQNQAPIGSQIPLA